MSDLEEFRHQKDEFFRSHSQSPLTAAQRRTFTGLRYYPENPSLRLRLPLDTSVPHEQVVMETSTGSKQVYVTAGVVRFEVESAPAQLTLYADAEGQTSFFLPFRDATSGHETYGGGRYLEVELEPDGTVTIDLNLAYSPYCAYNEHWTCPLPPIENWLQVPIRAGEMAYDQAEH